MYFCNPVEWLIYFSLCFGFQGLRNDLKAAMDKIDQQYLNEIVGGTESGEMDTQHDLKVHEENTTIEELEVHCTASLLVRGPSACRFRGSNSSSFRQALGKTLGRGDDGGDQEVIHKFLRVSHAVNTGLLSSMKEDFGKGLFYIHFGRYLMLLLEKWNQKTNVLDQQWATVGF